MKYKSLKDIGNLKASVDKSMLEVLSDNQSSEKERSDAIKSLRKSVDDILKVELEAFRNKDIEDCCRRLLAYLLMPNDDRTRRCFVKLRDLLANERPYRRNELNKKVESFADNAIIDNPGFSYNDLANLSIDSIINLFLKVEMKHNVNMQTDESKKEMVKEKQTEEKIEEGDIERRLSDDSDYFGEETQHVELKSSFVEAPKEADLDQPHEICRKICGFLNSEGGKLYIGVDPNTKRAYPKRDGKFLYGVERDIQLLRKNGKTYCNRPINDIATYCDYVKKRIDDIFSESNPQVFLFINRCIHVQPSDRNDNVAEIVVKPSSYCIVYLKNGKHDNAPKAYHRDGEECKEMTRDEILCRRQDLKSIEKSVQLHDKLEHAIKNHKQVILVGYASSHSETTTDRRVEPFQFVYKGDSVMCYQHDHKTNQKNRQFKISRISDVVELADEWKYEHLHEKAETDVFGWTAESKKCRIYHICLLMELRAKIDLSERYAKAQNDIIQKGDGIYLLDTYVYSLKPVRMFFLSMADSIRIQDTEDSDLLRKEIRDFTEKILVEL